MPRASHLVSFTAHWWKSQAVSQVGVLPTEFCLNSVDSPPSLGSDTKLLIAKTVIQLFHCKHRFDGRGNWIEGLYE